MARKNAKWLFLVILVLCGFAGCKKEAASGSGAVVENANFNPTGYPIVKEKINLRAAVLAVINNNPRKLWQRTEEVGNIHVDIFGVDPQQVSTFMAAGDWPDFFISNLNTAYINDHGIMGNQLVDYNTLLQYMPNLQECFEDYPLSKKVMTELNGAIYQLPYIEMQVTAANWGRFYARTDILRKYGVQIPSTIDELYNAMVTLEKATGNAPWLPNSIADVELFIYPSFGSSVETDFDSDAQNKVIFNRTSEQYKRFLQFLNKCYAEGLLHHEFFTLDAATKLQMGREGVFAFGNGAPIENLSLADFPSGEFDIHVFKPLTSQWNSATKVKGRLGGGIRTGGGAINAKSKYIPEIARMVDIGFALEEVVPGSGLYGTAQNYGPEGWIWRFTSPEKTEMDFIFPPEHPDITNHAILQWDWAVMTNFAGRAEFGSAVTTQKTNNRTRQIGFRDNLNPSLVFDFFPGGPPPQNNFLHFTLEEQSVIDSKYTDITAYVNEMRAKFITGVSDIDREWASYAQNLETMGIADVIKVYQAAYDRWNQM
jgi:putative aldouronate transport system substrate-binding protein